MKYLLFLSLGAFFAACTQAFWGDGFNLDVQNGVNVMHHGPGDAGNWRMAHSNDVGVMTMNHNGGRSMGVQVRNRLQLHWDPNQRRFVQKRSIEDASGPDAEVESTDDGPEDQENFSGDKAPEDQEESSEDGEEETTEKNTISDESGREYTDKEKEAIEFARHLYLGHKIPDRIKAMDERGKLYPLGFHNRT